ncbi:MAG TPA: nuclear transport factor 2 family protein [Puia sp.]
MRNIVKLPTVLVALITAQNEHNSQAFAEIFTNDALVHDEGKDYSGKAAIKAWNEDTNKKYNTRLEPEAMREKGAEIILTVLVSGTFEGSPITLEYHFRIKDSKIIYLNITG